MDAAQGERDARHESVVDAGECTQIAARLRLTPLERLRYLLDMLAFESLARNARRVGRR